MNYATHSFSVELATKIGVREAIILQHLYWWHEHNAALKSMNIDGRIWFYLSAAKIQEVFPYLSAQAVKTTIAHLIEQGYLVKDHKGEGQEKFDRTTWYSLTNSGISLFHLVISTNGMVENNHIVNNKSYYTSPNGESNNISISPKPPKFDFLVSLRGLGVEAATAQAWLQVRKAKRAVNTEIAFRAVEKEIALAGQNGHTAEDCIRLAAEKSWAGYKWEWHRNELTPAAPSHQGAAKPGRKAGGTAVSNMLALGEEMFGTKMMGFADEK